MTQWTDRQLEAITARNKRILVSAAAGSGKTAVLIERILSLLKEGMELDRMLVVTFTRAAAEEMKERLSDKLSQAAMEDAHLRRQYLMLGRADISTLHSFCQRLLKKHFQAADIDPLFSLADEPLAQELYLQALEDALDAFYEAPDQDARQLMERFPEADIIPMVRSLLDFLLAQQNPWQWLEEHLREEHYVSLGDHPWYQVLLREAGLLLSGAVDVLREARALCLDGNGPGRYLKALEDDLDLVRKLQDELEAPGIFPGAKPVYTRLSTAKAPPEEDPEKNQRVKDLRKQAKDLIGEALAFLPQGEEQAEEWMAAVRATLPQLKALGRLTRDVHNRFFALKKERALLDFSDLEHLALKALEDEGVRREVAGAYDALFVDEYQDISQIQEAIIVRLQDANNTLFMVGDVKQSIYRFRLADPGLFLHKSQVFSPSPRAENRLITLRENFRSTPNILSAVNLVFEHAMRGSVTEIEYDEEARLCTTKPRGGSPVELWLIEKSQEEARDFLPEEGEDRLSITEESEEDEQREVPDSKAGEMEQAFVYEARLIAGRIKALVGTPLGEEGAAIRYRDIAVLLRTASSRAPIMADILSQAGIPAYSDADGGFYEQQGVKDAMAILEVLDNPKNDIPLLHALACPAFSYTPAELADIRLHMPGRDVAFHEAFFAYAQQDARSLKVLRQLERWRQMAETMPLERFMALLLRQSGLYAVAGAASDGALRRANLRILVSRAVPNPQPQDLAGYLRRLKAGAEQNARDRSASLGLQEDVVRVMTLHKSKGLQFPVVFLPDLAAAFSRKRHDTALRLDAQTGMAMEQVFPEDRYKKDGVGISALKIKRSREELSEEARLLYVGMTRARERLIIIGAPANLERALKRAAQPTGEYAAGSAASMLDWVANPISEALMDKTDCLYQAEGGSLWQVGFVQTRDLPGEKSAGTRPDQLQKDIQRAMERGKADPEKGKAGEARFAWEEDTERDGLRTLFQRPPGETSPPQKISVTALVRGEYHMDMEETPETKRRPWHLRPAEARDSDAGLEDAVSAWTAASPYGEMPRAWDEPQPAAETREPGSQDAAGDEADGSSGREDLHSFSLELPSFLPPGQARPLTAAQRGAAAHKALCALSPGDFVDLQDPALTQALRTALADLETWGILTGAEREGIRLSDLTSYYRSPLARRMANSPEVHAEWPFTLLVEDRFLLQGVLDACFLEEGQWVLVDYKTDWGDPALLLQRYGRQMHWYMRALREITGLPVKEAWLYLLRRGQMVEVKEEFWAE